jgi:hypothetical protein
VRQAKPKEGKKTTSQLFKGAGGSSERYKAAISDRVEKTSDASAELIRERVEAVRANRMRSEMLLAKIRGELIPKELVEKQAAFLLIAMRQKILAMPQNHARQLLDISDTTVMATRLREISLGLLEELRHLPERVTDPHWLETLEEEDARQP